MRVNYLFGLSLETASGLYVPSIQEAWRSAMPWLPLGVGPPMLCCMSTQRLAIYMKTMDVYLYFEKLFEANK